MGERERVVSEGLISGTDTTEEEKEGFRPRWNAERAREQEC